MNKDFDQLAAVLKSCGIVASHYDAKMMAENINLGVAQSDSYYKKFYKPANSNGWSEQKNSSLIDTDSNITNHIHRDPEIENAPLEPEKEVFANREIASGPQEGMRLIRPSEGIAVAEPVAAVEALPVEAELPIAEPEVSFPEEKEVQEIADSILQEKDIEAGPRMAIKEASEPKIDFEIKSASAGAPKAEPSAEPVIAAPSSQKEASSDMDMQMMVKQMAEQMMQQMMAQQAAQQKALQEQIAKQQEVIQQMATQQKLMKEVSSQQSEPVPRPEPHPASQPQRPQQVFDYPAKEQKKDSGYFREIPVDRSRPKATLSREEEKITDITRIFNFSRR